MAKDAYEISLWHDIFVAPSGNIPGHYEEEKIAVIGSEKMTSQCRALEPKLVCNVNGKITFTFKMFYRYTDELTGEDYDNPFLKLLVNERKVKVYWLKKWYDLVIKNIQESSNGKSIVYTCEDANIYELGRTGFDLIFDDDLSVNNIDGGNQGTAQQLVERTLEGTDWVLGECDVIHQYTEEAVYEVELTRNLAAYDMIENQALSIPATTNGQATKILIYYPQLADFINNNTSGSVNINPFYIAYDPTQKYSRLARTEMLVQAKCYAYGSTGASVCQCTLSGNTLTFSSTNPEYGVFGSVDITQVSDQYRANRLVRQPTTKIEPVTGKSCYVYVANENGTGHYAGKVAKGDIIYESIGSEFGDALYATNLIANGKNFTSTAGWESPEPLQLVVYPITTALTEDRIVYLHLPPTANESRVYYNDAIRANSQHFKDGCKQGEIFRLRIKAKAGISGSYCTAGGLMLTPSVQQWDHQNTQCKQPKNGGKSYFSVSSPQAESGNTGWIYFDLTCIESFTGSDIYKDYIGLFLTQQPSATAGRHIEEIQFFKVVKDDQGNIILPEALETSGIIKTTYTYFKIVDDEIQYLYKGTEDWNKTGVNLTQEYNEGYSKIRSINIKQSNRFNILQTIAETFECWIRFWVPHDETGRLIYHNGIPEKTVTIRQEMGEERGIGFVYGIDLQSIQRTLESTQIVTKTIVLENNNKYGKNGTCRISRSNFNYPQTDYVLNFDYYINHQLMNGRELNADLYGYGGSPTTTRGFYADLHKWNSEYLKLSEENAQYEIALTKNEGLKTVYQNGIDAAIAEINDNKNWVVNMAAAKKYDSTVVRNYIAEYIDTYDELKAHVAAIEAQTKLSVYYEEQVAKLDQVIDTYNRTINSNKNRIKTLLRYIKQKTDLFNKKYSRFISEGSWIDQKYSDDNLYYVDANSVAYTSSRPKVSYNIAVLRVTGIEGFELKDFQLGDISYIEDTDFFGYTYIQHGNEQVKTPYREKVVITEVTYNFDEPKKDTFKVQNYRTQFEDLFQRIAAQTQSLQYTVGAYNKVSDIIETDGTIKGGTIKSSIDLNNDALNRTSLNNLVTTDERGVTVQSLVNPSQAVRITAGGLFITTNGGDSWNNAIRGDGIGTQFLSSGSINTRDIQIINGDNEFDEAAVAFKWNIEGITAYDSFSTESSVDLAYDKGKYVRFNNEGISIQTRAGSAITSPSYEKLKMGRLNEQNEYGLRINTYNNGATETAFQATESGLFVKGNISATSLTIGDGVTLPAESVEDESGRTLFQIIDGEISSEVSLINLLPSVYASEANYGNPRTSNGITWTVNSDGSVTANGTATADSWYAFAGSTTTADIPSIRLDPNKQYSISGCSAGGSSSKYSFQAAFYTENQTPSSDNSGATWALDYGNGATMSSGYRWANVYAVVRNGVTVNNKVFYPMLNYGTKVQPYLSTHNGTYQLSSKITQTANDIALVATRTTTLESQSRNLVRNSYTFENWSKSSDAIIGNSSEGGKYARLPATTTLSYRYLTCWSGQNDVLTFSYSRIKNKTITISVFVLSPDYASIDGTLDNRLAVYLSVYPKGSSTRSRYAQVGVIPNTLSNSYKRYSWTVNITDAWFSQGTGTMSDDDGIAFTFYNHSLYSATIIHPQIEIGETVSAYSPNSIDDVAAKSEAAIKINADQIQSTVTQVSGFEDRLEEAETAITQTSSGIELLSTRTSAIANLLQNSGTFDDWTYTTKTAAMSINPVTFFKSTDTTAYSGGSVYGCTVANFPIMEIDSWRYVSSKGPTTKIPYRYLKDKTITVSCRIAVGDVSKVPNGQIGINLELCHQGETARTRYRSVIGTSGQVSTSYKLFYNTVTINNNWFLNGSGTGDVLDSDDVYLTCWVGPEVTTYVRFLVPQIQYGSLKQGEVPIWTAATGDRASAQLIVQAGEISSKVEKNGVISAIRQTSETVQIQASKIDLEGAVTFSSFSSGLQSDFNTVSSNASSALSAANGALNTSIPLYYRTTSSTAPAAPSSQVTITYQDTDDVWTTVMPRPKRPSSGQYYYYTCQQWATKAGTYKWSTVKTVANLNYTALWCHKENQTFIDGGSIYTNSITASKIALPDLSDLTDANGNGTKLGGLTMTSGGLRYDATAGGVTHRALVQAAGSSTTTHAFAVRSSNDGFKNDINYDFYVNYDGKLYSNNADIKGKITASQGSIAGWAITSGSLYSDSPAGEAGISTIQGRAYLYNPDSITPTTTAIGVQIREWNGSSYGSWSYPFGVRYNGELYATKVRISGDGTIGGCTMSNGVLTVPAANVSGLLTAATIKASSINVSDGKIDASQINVGTISINGLSGTLSANKISTDLLRTNDLSTTIAGMSLVNTKAIKINESLRIGDTTSLWIYTSQTAYTSKIPRWINTNIEMMDTSGTTSYTALRSKINEIIQGVNGWRISGS